MLFLRSVPSKTREGGTSLGVEVQSERATEERRRVGMVSSDRGSRKRGREVLLGNVGLCVPKEKPKTHGTA